MVIGKTFEPYLILKYVLVLWRGVAWRGAARRNFCLVVLHCVPYVIVVSAYKNKIK